MNILKVGAALSCALFSAAVANASTTIQTFDSGWYQNNGLTAGVSNINVGSSNTTGALYNNYLAFNLASLAGQNITSATLTFYGGNGVNTSSTSETLGLFDYTGSINTLLSDGFNSAVYTDLGNGVSYGTAVVAPGAIPQFTITLTAAAIANMNAAVNGADKRFVIGGSLQTVSGPWANEQLFAIYGPTQALSNPAFLTIDTAAVPEPASWAMMIAGFGVIGLGMRRRAARMSARFA